MEVTWFKDSALDCNATLLCSNPSPSPDYGILYQVRGRTSRGVAQYRGRLTLIGWLGAYMTSR
jgi:hypothetical protein